MATLKTYLRYTSWPIIAAMVALMGIGLAAIDAAEKADWTAFAHVATRQAVFAPVALVVFVIVTIVPYQRWGRFAYALFAATLLLLVVVLYLPARREAQRWIGLGPVAFQPSELAKLSFIVLLAWYLRYGDRYRRLRGLIVPFVLTFVPMGLILIEPDLGTSLLFLPTLYFMLFLAGAKLRVVMDRDEAGYAWALGVLDSVQTQTIELYEPIAGKDVSDHLAAGHKMEDLRPISSVPYLEV